MKNDGKGRNKVDSGRKQKAHMFSRIIKYIIRM